MATRSRALRTGEDNVEKIDRQLQDAVNFCISSGLSPAEISKCAEPVIQWANRKKRQRTLRMPLKLAIAVVFIAVLWGNESCFRWLCIGCKLLQLKLLPYWDWTHLYQINCMISNPYYVEETVSAEDCKWCEQYRDVQRLKSISHDVMTNDYILKQNPVIVADAAISQSAANRLSFKELQKMYLTEEVYEPCLQCEFESSIYDYNMTGFLASILSGSSFNAHWSNCEFDCMKAFRKFYQRPYFIPPMVGVSDENFVLVGQKKAGNNDDSDITAQYFIRPGSMIWITQIKGQFLITLMSQCGCNDIEEILQEGETLAFTGKTWWFKYKAIGEGEVIAVGSSGNWD